MQKQYDKGFMQSILKKSAILLLIISGVIQPSYLHVAAPSFGDWTVVGPPIPLAPAPTYNPAPGSTDGTGFWQGSVCEWGCDQDTSTHLTITSPVITLPSTGALTYISVNDTGTPSVTNNLMTVVGTLIGTTKDIGPFAPGTHTLTWQAIDSGGLPLSITQTLNIIPQVSFGTGMVVGEGGSVSVPVYLNGPAVAYPVEIPYSVSGSATSPDDHDAIDGMLTIASGTEGAITFHVVDDGVTGEPDEAILLSLGTPVNAVLGTYGEQTVTITEDNLPPIVGFSVSQGVNESRIVVASGGVVTITATIRDPNTGDHHTTDWGDTENNLLAIGSVAGNVFLFDPGLLTPGVYKVVVKVDDDCIPSATTVVDLLLKITSEIPVQEISNTINKTLIFGAYITLENLQLEWEVPQEEGDSLQTDPGVQIRQGNSAFSSGKDARIVTIEDIAAYGDGGKPVANADDGNIPEQIFDFEITGLNNPGQLVHVVLPLQSPIPSSAVYRKYTFNSGWIDFVSDDYNSISSAPFNEGFCPPVSSNLYEDGIIEGYQCIQLLLQDGGPNDADHSANGVIKDPGGVISIQPRGDVQEWSSDESIPFTSSPDSDSWGSVQESSPDVDPPATSSLDNGSPGGTGWVGLFSLITLAGFAVMRKK